jgi:hypothetical protein
LFCCYLLVFCFLFFFLFLFLFYFFLILTLFTKSLHCRDLYVINICLHEISWYHFRCVTYNRKYIYFSKWSFLNLHRCDLKALFIKLCQYNLSFLFLYVVKLKILLNVLNFPWPMRIIYISY